MVVPSWFVDFRGARKLGQGSAPVQELEEVWRRVREACAQGVCIEVSFSHCGYEMGNSIVISAPQMRFAELFPEEKDVRLVQTTVLIWGSSESIPHTHNSHVIMLILAGIGWLDYWPDGPKGHSRSLPLCAGSLLVTPAGVWHHLNCMVGESLVTVGVEVAAGKDLYYQQNQYPPVE
jgi:quercetin dioxygenase-like cupin family protein